MRSPGHGRRSLTFASGEAQTRSIVCTGDYEGGLTCQVSAKQTLQLVPKIQRLLIRLRHKTQVTVIRA